MISLKEARRRLFRFTPPYRYERVPLSEAGGRVLADDVFASFDAPAFDRVVMDGYAVRAADVRRAPVSLDLKGRRLAGDPGRLRVRRGACVLVATGSVLPAGADTVVPVEAAQRKGRAVVIRQALERGAHVARRGIEVRRGARLLGRRSPLTPLRCALLASQGFSSVRVVRRPTVAILPTGNEIVPPGRRRRPGQIFDATTPLLVEELRALGITPRVLGVAPDEPRLLKRSLRLGLRSDVLIVTGSMSVGARDWAPSVLKACGVRFLFHGVRIRPGKPCLSGVLGRRLVLGFPGNPLSAWIVWRVLARPLLRRWMGEEPRDLREGGRLGAAAVNRSDRFTFSPARLSQKRGAVRIRPLAWKGSADLAAAGRADVFFGLPAASRAAEGSPVPFFRTERS